MLNITIELKLFHFIVFVIVCNYNIKFQIKVSRLVLNQEANAPSIYLIVHNVKVQFTKHNHLVIKLLGCYHRRNRYARSISEDSNEIPPEGIGSATDYMRLSININCIFTRKT